MKPSTPTTGAPLKCSLHDWVGLRTQLAYIFDSRIPNGTADGTYLRHNQMSAWLLRKGSIELEADGEQATARAGDWVICTAQKIRQRLSHDVSLLSIRLYHDWPSGAQLFGGRSICQFPACGHEELESAALEVLRCVGKVEFGQMERSYAFLWRTRLDYVSYMRQQAYLSLWLSILGGIVAEREWILNIPAGVDARLAQALHLIDMQDMDKAFPAGAMVAASGLTLRQLNIACEKAYSLTTHAYWDKRRLEKASQALDQGESHIKAIASSLGFTQLSHFSAWFKRHTGLPPRAYRNSKRAE